MEHPVEVTHLKEQFYTRRGIYKALNGVDAFLEEGEVLGIAGESGCGKTTLGLTMIGLLARNAAITDGQVKLEGHNIVETLKEYATRNPTNFRPTKNEKLLKELNKQLTGVRGKKISMVFQDPMTSLNPVMQVGYQIAETMVVHMPVVLARRRLSRARATRQDLTKILTLLKTGSTQESITEYAKSKNLQGIEEQVLNLWRRKDMAEAKKEKLIMSLHSEKLSSFEQKLLENLEQTGSLPTWINWVPWMRSAGKKVLTKEGYRRAVELLSILEVPNADRVVMMYPHELSGGMRQRVVIAIALANDPKIVILDEPTSALDVTVQAQILDLVRHLKQQLKISFIFISHDLSVLLEVCDRIAIMYAGKLIEIAPTDLVFNDPYHPYTKMLIKAIPTLEGEEVRGIAGSVPDMRSPPAGCAFHPRCPFAMEVCMKEEPPLIEVAEKRHVACYLYPGVQKQ